MVFSLSRHFLGRSSGDDFLDIKVLLPQRQINSNVRGGYTAQATQWDTVLSCLVILRKFSNFKTFRSFVSPISFILNRITAL